MVFLTKILVRVVLSLVLSGNSCNFVTTYGISMCRLKCQLTVGCEQITFEPSHLCCCLSTEGVNCPNELGYHSEHITISGISPDGCEDGSRIIISKRDKTICGTDTSKQFLGIPNLPSNRTCGMSDAWKRHKLVFEGLLQSDIDSCVLDKLGPSAIDCTHGHLENDFVDDLVDALDDAVCYGRLEQFDFLVDRGCFENTTEEGGDTILHEASENGHANIVERILSLGLFNKDSRGAFKATPIMYAAEEGHKDVFDLLVKHGSSMYDIDEFNDTLLHKACEGGNVEIVEYLLSLKIFDKEVRGYNQETPLLRAVDEDHMKVVDILLKQGCDIRAVDADNQTVLHLALNGVKNDTLKHLLTIPGVKEMKNKRRHVLGDTPLEITLNNTGLLRLFKS